MKNSIKYVLVLAFACLALTVSAQKKYGFVNLGNLLEMMPERTTADAKLQGFQEGLVAQEEEMAKNFQAFIAEAEKKAPSLSEEELQQLQRQAYEKEQEIMKFRQSSLSKVQQKRQELLAPILVRVQEAIDAVAKENGYALIFDSSIINTILYAEETQDVLPLVKKKLGIE